MLCEKISSPLRLLLVSPDFLDAPAYSGKPRRNGGQPRQGDETMGLFQAGARLTFLRIILFYNHIPLFARE